MHEDDLHYALYQMGKYEGKYEVTNNTYPTVLIVPTSVALRSIGYERNVIVHIVMSD